MASFLHVLYLLSISYLVTAQSDLLDPSATDIGILQLVTPTTHANQVPITALAALTTDALSFYKGYTQLDTFNYESAQLVALESLPASAAAILNAGGFSLDQVYDDAYTSLLDNPILYLSRLHASVSPWPSAFSAAVVSQASGILIGYESLVSQDVLSKNSTSGPVTPGMSISMGPAMTSASATSSGMGATQASQGMGTVASTTSSKAAGVPMVTGSPLLLINAAMAAAGVVGVAMM
ncbi:hypothetical protein MMC34_007729 [Xylographa carneopallida]|nr:hypothetical protein [Xylographa carneopallida]